MARQWTIFLNSFFFVLGFSVVFSLVGVLLQSVLSSVSFTVHLWLARIGGVIIIFFGLYLLRLIHIPFLEREHKLRVMKRFRYSYLTSFVFGAAFAVGWSPCAGAILGAVLTLAITQPTNAFFLLFAYSLGLSIPFLLVGLFTQKAQNFIQRAGKWLRYVQYIFGVIAIWLGILVFTQQLSRIANFAFASDFLVRLNLVSSFSGSSLNIGIAFLAGLFSFLSPCVLPLVPAFLTYLGTTITNNE